MARREALSRWVLFDKTPIAQVPFLVQPGFQLVRVHPIDTTNVSQTPSGQLPVSHQASQCCFRQVLSQVGGLLEHNITRIVALNAYQDACGHTHLHAGC